MARILLLEDDPILGKSIKLGLELKGYVVDWAKDIKTAKMIHSQGGLDLYLLDWNLPDGKGIDFCVQVREDRLSVPVIFLTALTDEENAVQALASGANDFVRKPAGQAELMARVGRALGEQQVVEPQIRFGDLIVLPKQRKVKYHEAEVELYRREFDILVQLVRKGGSPVTREELLERLSPGDEIFDRTIDSHLSHLRAKLRKANIKDVQVVSVYGLGYKLEKKAA